MKSAPVIFKYHNVQNNVFVQLGDKYTCENSLLLLSCDCQESCFILNTNVGIDAVIEFNPIQWNVKG